jgi:hypothetical protein
MTVNTTCGFNPISDAPLEGGSGVVTYDADVAAFESSGGWVLVYDGSNGTTDSAGYDVYNADGSHAEGGFNPFNAAVATSSTNWAHIAGESEGDVVVQSLHFLVQDDNTYSRDRQNSIGLGPGSNADIAQDPFFDRYAVVWQRNFSPTDNDIYLSIRNADDSAIKTLVVDGSGADDRNASVVYLNNGNVAVVWNRFDGSGQATLWEAMYDRDGNTVLAPTSTGFTSDGGHPGLTAAGSSQLQVVYGSGDPANPDINGLFVTIGGTSHAGPVATLAGPDGETASTVVPHSNMVAVVFTHTLLDSGDVRDQDLYLALYDAQNGSVATGYDHPFALDVSGHITSDPSVTALPGGRLLVSYFDTFDGAVHQKIVQLTEAITGDNNANILSSRLGGVLTADGAGGDDTFYATGAVNNFSGGSGDDVFEVGQDSTTFIDGGSGTDRVDFNALDPAISISLATTTPQNTSSGTITLKNVENLGGTFNADTLIGNDGANELLDGGNLGDGPEKDTLIGGNGNDTYVVSDSSTSLSRHRAPVASTWSRAATTSCCPTSSRT